MPGIDETHDPELQSWVETANRSAEFPIQNLPLASFVHNGERKIGVGIGDSILDLKPWLEGNDLAEYFRLSAADRNVLRKNVSRALSKGSSVLSLCPQSECELLLPCAIGDYTDFYASIDHARNLGAMFRPDNPLLPNYRHLPIGYHGRSSSIVVSGTPVIRPSGQLGEGQFGPTAELDYEIELGAFVGPGNTMGQPISLLEAEEQVAGVCLLNDWSARDIQRWEYQPLGPFLSKNFATTISPWVITTEALAPFRVTPPQADRVELPYLRTTDGALDIAIEGYLKPANATEEVRLSRAHFREMYWTFAQMIAHHTVNGCPLRPGDLLGSGTISGPEKENRGCLLELTRKGREPVALPDGTVRSFLHDGDEVILRAHCAREGFRSIGFKECRGVVRSHTTL